MKLVRFGPAGDEKPGLLEGSAVIDVTGFGEDFGESFFGSGGMARLAQWRRGPGATAQAIGPGTRLGPCIARPSKIICIGLNYKDHAAETGAELPNEPIIFGKATTAMAGPGDPLVIPLGSEQTDWEVELALVIGRRASYVDEAEALDYVAGYCLANDYSERSYQLARDGQWIKGKSADSFAPLGPFLATPDELGDVHALRMWLKVNGETKQDGTTADMIFGVPTLVSYLSQFMTLLPGDVISTGTPAGVGHGMKPQQFLKAGDVIEYGIEGLGETRQVAKALGN